MPYDQFARTLVTAQGSSSNQSARQLHADAAATTGKITEDVSQTFLGVRFNCNKCHDHPVRAVDAGPVLRVRRILRPRGVQARRQDESRKLSSTISTAAK